LKHNRSALHFLLKAIYNSVMNIKSSYDCWLLVIQYVVHKLIELLFLQLHVFQSVGLVLHIQKDYCITSSWNDNLRSLNELWCKMMSITRNVPCAMTWIMWKAWLLGHVRLISKLWKKINWNVIMSSADDEIGSDFNDLMTFKCFYM